MEVDAPVVAAVVRCAVSRGASCDDASRATLVRAREAHAQGERD
jgi:hypothetical protein